MSFLLKIVEGPNKGAEIALVEGVAVTLGKGDDCDVVLADSTMPEVPLKIEASADGVTIDGAALDPFEVKTLGATSFAVGPTDTPWGVLKWPKREEVAEEPEGSTEKTKEAESNREQAKEAEKPVEDAPAKKRGGRCGCIVAFIVLLLMIASLVWFFIDRIGKSDRLANFGEIGRGWYSKLYGGHGDSIESSPSAPAEALSAVASKYGLIFAESNGAVRMSGNLRTRRERLAATAEAYQALPGVELDLSDDESFRTAAEDALFTLSEGALKVAAATNRFLSVVGSSSSPMSLKNTLVALNADLPKLRNVDVSGVVMSLNATASSKNREVGQYGEKSQGGGASTLRRGRKASASTSMPVCGILTMPYPCLVMRDGKRIFEGASIGDSVILKIEADSVTVTNSTGRVEWKP